MTKIGFDELDEMVDYINELTKLYERNEKAECIFNPLLFLKMLSLPFYEGDIKEKENIIQQILSKTPCQDRIEIYKEQFIIFYKDWLKRHHPEALDKLKNIKIFHIDEFIDVEREIDIKQIKSSEIIDAKTFLATTEIEEDIIINLLASINNMIDISKEYDEINDEFIEKLFRNNEFINFFLYSIEFKDLSYALEILKLKLLSLEYDKLSKEQKILLKKILDSILEDLNNWVYKVLIEKSAIDIHYLDESLVANIAQIDLLLESKNSQNDDVEMF